MDKEILENHKKYLERKALYKSLGYDVDKERDFVLEQAKPVYGKILEAGTGKGHFALELAKAGYNFTTFDISETEQAFAKLNFRYFNLYKQVDFRIENGESLSFKDKSFDVIFSVNTLHHLTNPHKVIDELLRVLSLGGKLVLSDFTKEGLDLMDKIHANEGNKHEAGKITLSDIERYLIEKGFKVDKMNSKFQGLLIAHQQSI
ncbi:MAG: class I SAM-dependent methyltransferase [Candidatus Omnitrophica bacterium]|nr:class I SAM-dependent methyltransferase [Candidatus Omnitrophota bacterium]MDD5352030.1 class I SAM-dependent methyltransferase [Candidatus Omnitrophota bacterium]